MEPQGKRSRWFHKLVESDTEFSPFTLQLFGALIIVVVLVYYFFSGQVSAALLGTGGTLIGLGQYGSVLHKIRDMQEKLEDKTALEHPPHALELPEDDASAKT